MPPTWGAMVPDSQGRCNRALAPPTGPRLWSGCTDCPDRWPRRSVRPRGPPASSSPDGRSEPEPHRSRALLPTALHVSAVGSRARTPPPRPQRVSWRACCVAGLVAGRHDCRHQCAPEVVDRLWRPVIPLPQLGLDARWSRPSVSGNQRRVVLDGALRNAEALGQFCTRVVREGSHAAECLPLRSVICRGSTSPSRSPRPRSRPPPRSTSSPSSTAGL